VVLDFLNIIITATVFIAPNIDC